MATMMKTDGSRMEVNPSDGKMFFSLEEAQKMVGGYVQVVPLGDGNILVVNEDGKPMGLPVNREATSIMHRHYPMAVNDCIVGDVLMCMNNEF